MLGVPKVAIIAAPIDAPTLSGRTLGAGETDILVRMISIGQPHRAVLVDAETDTEADGVHVCHATVYRTAHRLFTGEVYYRRPT